MTDNAKPLLISRRLRPRNIPGGINPAANKTRSLRSRIMPMPVPASLTLSLQQYNGDVAIPDVKVGDPVLKYQRLATPANPFGICVHAPTSGRVSAITNTAVAGLPGAAALCIVLETDGDEHELELFPVHDYLALEQNYLLELLAGAGLCGMGRAGFPTAEKLRLGIEHGIESLIINAVECEPYISSDQALLRERAEQVVTGADILRHACGASHCVIAVSEDMADAILELRKALTHSAIDLQIVTAKYPAGSEKQLIQALTGRELPAGKRPYHVGLLMFNAGTAYASYQAIIEGKPCISRITTLTGSSLRTPKNFEALIGTPVSFLLNLCGIDHSRHIRTLHGGSLMGFELQSDAVPISKTSNCLIALGVGEAPEMQDERPCIGCGYCVDACPVSLLPQQLYNYSRAHDQEQLLEHGLFDCIECGACSYVCPSHIPLVQYYLASKSELQALQQQRQQGQAWQSRFQFHQYRVKKEKDEAREKRRIPSQPATNATAKSVTPAFSRELAKQEIADAVARAKAKQAANKKARDKDATLSDHNPKKEPE